MSNRILNPYPKGHVSYAMNFDEQTHALKSIKLDDLKTFYKDFYNSAKATVSVVGDCDESATVQALTAILQNWSSTQNYSRIGDRYFDAAGAEQKINTPDKKNAMYVAGVNLQLSDADPDYPALVLGNFILGGGFLNSRLATRIRQNEGISYGVGSYLYANAMDTSGVFGSYAIYNPENLDKLDKAYKEELNKIIKEGIKADELEAAKSGYLQNQQVERSQDNVLVYKLNNNLYLNRSMSWEADQEKMIANLTVEQVNAALKKYIHPDKLVIIKAGDFDKPKSGDSKNK